MLLSLRLPCLLTGFLLLTVCLNNKSLLTRAVQLVTFGSNAYPQLLQCKYTVTAGTQLTKWGRGSLMPLLCITSALPRCLSLEHTVPTSKCSHTLLCKLEIIYKRSSWNHGSLMICFFFYQKFKEYLYFFYLYSSLNELYIYMRMRRNMCCGWYSRESSYMQVSVLHWSPESLNNSLGTLGTRSCFSLHLAFSECHLYFLMTSWITDFDSIYYVVMLNQSTIDNKKKKWWNKCTKATT